MKDNKQLFKKYYSRLAKEGLVKALICGLIVGFTLSFIPAVISLFLNYNGLWISLAVIIAAAAAATPVFYYKLFRPDTKKMIERIDRLGLDERLITMLELENDESYIAMLQREDAKEKLSHVRHGQLKLSFFIVPIIVCAVLAIGSIAMIVVSATSVEGRVAYAEIVREVNNETPIEDDHEYEYYIVTYLIYMGSGYFDGDAFQIVAFDVTLYNETVNNDSVETYTGESATMITAVANEGYVFVDWFDTRGEGSVSASRTDENIREDIIALARFEPVSDQTDEEKSDPQNQETVDGDFDPNVIIDGATYYREPEVWDLYYAEAMARLIATGEDIPADLRELLQLYFDAIK